ncbi:MAG: MarR family transcriptional regulator [Scytonematopsis contorta HA4267-MV1]|jgi:DNA-binding MarR family transcriptional regulator|nr:MarR family transcriptional regulator [Scytonematopsis contorta HA4267-MV1]
MFTPRNIPTDEVLQELGRNYPDLEINSVRACLAFLTTTAEVYEAFDTHFARYGLSMGKFTVLMQLLQASDTGLTPSECADRTNVTRGTITGLLDGLEREQLVQRQPHPADRRMLTVKLTIKGQELLDKMLPDHFCRTTGLMSNLSTEEKKIFVQLLAKLRAGTPVMREA